MRKKKKKKENKVVAFRFPFSLIAFQIISSTRASKEIKCRWNTYSDFMACLSFLVIIINWIKQSLTSREGKFCNWLFPRTEWIWWSVSTERFVLALTTERYVLCVWIVIRPDSSTNSVEPTPFPFSPPMHPEAARLAAAAAALALLSFFRAPTQQHLLHLTGL